jgi:flagellar hook-basal body complex protein FliE
VTVTPLDPALPLGAAPSLEPDLPLGPAGSPESSAPAPGGGNDFASALGRALDDAGASFERAGRAERAFESGRGGLQEMTVERAQADIALSLAAATASRAVTALNTILGMQV